MHYLGIPLVKIVDINSKIHPGCPDPINYNKDTYLDNLSSTHTYTKYLYRNNSLKLATYVYVYLKVHAMCTCNNQDL